MDFKNSSQTKQLTINLKSKLLLFALAIALSISTLRVYAADDYSGWASSIVDSVGTSSGGGTGKVVNGLS